MILAQPKDVEQREPFAQQPDITVNTLPNPVMVTGEEIPQIYLHKQRDAAPISETNELKKGLLDRMTDYIYNLGRDAHLF